MEYNVYIVFKVNDIIVFHDSSGRFDQIMANINTLFTRHDNIFNIYLLSGCSLTWLLKPGKHSITIPDHLVAKERWCSLIPIGHEATNVTTRGLKWNLCKCIFVYDHFNQITWLLFCL